MPDNLLHKNKNDIFDGVEVINLDSEGNIEPNIDVKDEDVIIDINVVAEDDDKSKSDGDSNYS